jgi:2-C-methyl-D-erythritol 4-phosphate cytidylyltransferase
VVVPEKERAEFDRVLRSAGDLGALHWVLEAGGARRQDSVRLGLERLDPDCEIVVVHDAVRPLVSPALIDRLAEAADRDGAAVAGLPVTDTIKIVAPGRRVRSTPARDSLWAVQTPQAFRVALLREAHARGKKDGVEATDDAMLVERLGKTVAVLEGDPSNIKITTPEDLLLAEALLREGRVS